jgi:hypothetical protein
VPFSTRFARSRRPVAAARLVFALAAGVGLLLSAPLALAADRANAVDCEAIVQATYWDLRNEGKGEAFPYARYADVLAARAERTARLVTYLRGQRGRDLDRRELQAEIDRMGRDTRAPEALGKLFKALGNDPQLIGECVAKPALVERLARQYFARDAAVHGPTARQADAAFAAARARGVGVPAKAMAATPLIRAGLDERVANPATSEPARAAVRTLQQFDVVEWQIAPKAATTRWSKLREGDTDYRAVRGDYRDGQLELRVLRWPKQSFESWWAQAAGSFTADYADKATGALTLPQLAAGEPAGWTRMRDEDSYLIGVVERAGVVVSSGAEVLLWGGRLPYSLRIELGNSGYTNGGLAYNPVTDAWRKLPMLDAPPNECDSAARGLWTGTKLLVVVGACSLQPRDGGDVYTVEAHGGLYDPVADAWQPIPAPPASWTGNGADFSAVWTGSKAIYYGGRSVVYDTPTQPVNTGATFDPATLQWTAFAISPAQIGLPSSERYAHQAVWTGSTMIVLGGGDLGQNCQMAWTGFSFNPFTGVGSALPPRPDALRGPFGRAFWNGSKVVTYAPASPYSCGGVVPLTNSVRYDPAQGTWSAVNPTGDPRLSGPSQLVGNNQLVVWGGYSMLQGGGEQMLASGAIYRIDTNTWTPMAAAGAPRARQNHFVAAVGNEAVFLGGECQGSQEWIKVLCGDAGRFNAATNSWRAAALPPPPDGPPEPRDGAAVAGSGTEMYVWGGGSPEWNVPDPADGAVYNSVTDEWTPIPSTGAPSVRENAFSAVASGRFIVLGGVDPDPAVGTPLGNGGRYDPVARTWSALPAPPLDLARLGMATTFDGTWLVAWGGSLAGVAKADGARYNPATNAWATLPTTGAPSARTQPLAVANAGKTLLWRGATGATGGAIYNSATNAWAAVPENGTFPAGTFAAGVHEAVWLGDRFGVLGEATDPNVLYRLDNAATGAWSAASSADAPDLASYSNGRHALWTGKNLLVVGGSSNEYGGYGPRGWLYRPTANVWMETPRTAEPRSTGAMVRIGNLTAVWGGPRYNSGSLWHDDARTGTLNADLAVSIQVAGQQFLVDRDLLTLQVVVTNHGPEIITTASAEIDLQANMRLDSLSAPGNRCLSWYTQTGVARCPMDALEPGESRVMTAVVQLLREGQLGPAVAVATVRTGGGIETDPVPANNTARFVLPALRIRDVRAAEGNSGTRQLVFTATLSEPAAWPVTFDIVEEEEYMFGATAGEDYTAFGFTGLTIPAGQLATTFAVTVHGDTTHEQNEIIALAAAHVEGAYAELTHAAGTIVNDDGPTVTVAPAAVVEGNTGTTTLTFTATLSQPVAEEIRFTASSQPTIYDTAELYVDVEQMYVVQAVIPAGQLTGTFSASVIGDTVAEGNETFTFGFDNKFGDFTMVNDQVAGTILNDDGPGLSIGDASLVEGDTGTRMRGFTATLAQASANAVTFDFAATGGSATPGADFLPVSATGVSIPAGALSLTFYVPILGDTQIEADETYAVDVTNIAFAKPLDAHAVGTILDDDQPRISIGDVSVLEGNAGTSTATFTVALSAAGNVPVTFDIATANDTAIAGSDYVARTLAGETIAAGQLSRTFAVTIQGDTTAEANEWFRVNLYNVGGATLVDSQALGIVLNDEGPTLSIDDASVVEGNSGTRTVVFTARLSQAAATPVTFNLATANGTATAGSDYVAKSQAGLSIAAGQLSATFAVTVNGDGAAEPIETFAVNLSAASGATIADAQALGTIVNDDGLTLSISDVAVGEGNAGTKTAVLTATLSQTPAAPVSFTVTTADGSAIAGSDYTGGSTVLTIPAGQRTRAVSVAIKGDVVVEGNETVLVNLSGATGGATVLDGQGVATVLNDDGPTVSISDATLTEGQAGTKLAVFTVSLSQAAAGPVTYNIGTADLTAAAGTDYVARTLQGEVIPAGQLSRVFAVTVNGDTAVEGNEAFKVTLTATGATVFDYYAVGTLLNDDGPTLSVDDMTVVEGQSGTKAATFTVRLSQAAALPVTFGAATASDTATAGSDFVASTQSGLTIPAGQLTRTVSVTLNGDTGVEANEAFVLNLTAATNASILDGQGIATVLNDDGPTLSIADVQLAEGNAGTKTMTFTVQLSQAAGVPVTYSIATANDTAAAGSDYVASALAGETIPAGQLSRPFAVTLVGDTVVEPNQWFKVNLGPATGATVFDAQALGVIVNDD